MFNHSLKNMSHSINVKISDEFREKVSGLKVLILQCRIANSPTSPQLVEMITGLADAVKSKYQLPDINRRPGIAATREAYKRLGKDPNRYRPSQEQLLRRIVNGKELYYINNAVDIFNYVSIYSGYAIGAFDADKICGNSLTLGIGRTGEPYEGIGRGNLNIEFLPVYRDSVGGVGTPTSDNERTKISLDTTRLLVCFNIYGEEISDSELQSLSENLLGRFCGAYQFHWETI